MATSCFKNFVQIVGYVWNNLATPQEKETSKWKPSEQGVSIEAQAEKISAMAVVQAAGLVEIIITRQGSTCHPAGAAGTQPLPVLRLSAAKNQEPPGAYTVYFVECPECQARGPVASSEEKTKATWIQRAK